MADDAYIKEPILAHSLIISKKIVYSFVSDVLLKLREILTMPRKKSIVSLRTGSPFKCPWRLETASTGCLCDK